MPMRIRTGSLMQCTFGMLPGTFSATPRTVQTSSQTTGNVMDHVPMVDIVPFGMCRSPANPAVAAATAAAFGMLTPMPCVPVTPAPWTPGAATVLVCGMPALDDGSRLMSQWGGVISFAFPGQVTEQIS